MKTEKSIPKHPETIGELGLINYDLSEMLSKQESLLTNLFEVFYKLKGENINVINEDVELLQLEYQQDCRIGELKNIKSKLHNHNLYLKNIIDRFEQTI